MQFDAEARNATFGSEKNLSKFTRFVVWNLLEWFQLIVLKTSLKRITATVNMLNVKHVVVRFLKTLVNACKQATIGLAFNSNG